MYDETGMKRLYSIHWKEFIFACERWRTLAPEIRKRMLNQLNKTGFIPGDISEETFGYDLQLIRQTGLVEVSSKGKGTRITEKYIPFFMLINETKEFHLNPNYSYFNRYFIHYFNQIQANAFSENRNGYMNPHDVYLQVTAEEWVENILNSKDRMTWKVDADGRRESKNYIHSENTFQFLQKFIRLLLERKEPIPVKELAVMFKPQSEELNEALNAGLRYLLFYLSTDIHTLEPLLFIWPEIHQRLNRPKLETPQPVSPEGEEFCRPYFIQDLATILSECATAPLRIRTADYQIYEKSMKSLEKQIEPYKAWVFNNLPSRDRSRVGQAIWVAYQKGYLFKTEDRRKSTMQYEVSEEGRHWLGLSKKEQLKIMIAPSRGLQGAIGLVKGMSFYSNIISNYENQDDFLPLGQSLMESFASLKKNCFYSVDEFVNYGSRERNPLQQENKGEKKWLKKIMNWKIVINRQNLEMVWVRTMESFIFNLFQPLGGVRLVNQPDEKMLFALNDIGGYILDQEQDFAFEEEEINLVVQPNFEVMFLAPSVQAEAVFLRFAERLGRGVGTLFRITKKSIQRAAGGGLKLEAILQDLSRLSRVKIPQNVQHEVREWHQSCKRISVEPVYLIRCPDETTAALVCAKAGKVAETVSETTVVLPKNFDKSKLFAKLRELGVFLEKGEYE